MIGTFTTRCFDSRADFIERRSSGVYVSRNAFTDTGLRWMWEAMAGGGDDNLASARLVVGDGDRAFSPSDEALVGPNFAEASLDEGYPTIEVQTSEGIGRLLFRATFGEDTAVFNWSEKGVVTAKGVLLDRSVSDQGRKVLGAVWQLEAALDILRGD